MLWKNFVAKEQLSEKQSDQFSAYMCLLSEWNKKINLTAINEADSVIPYHFQDSIRVTNFIDFKAGDVLCDVGSGGGFPGIPLKIMLPDVSVVLIEVNQKKVRFLRTVIDALGLTDISIYTQDWRTFLRQVPVDSVNYVCARASLAPEELIRVFKENCPYRDATLVYWASQRWEPTPVVASHITTEYPYVVGSRNRRFVVMDKKS